MALGHLGELKINDDSGFGIHRVIKQFEGVLSSQPGRIGTEEQPRFQVFKGGLV